MPLPDPLPRALAPLPGEGLAGLLLRLGHRLDVAPFQLIQRTGIGTSDTYVPGRLLLTFDDHLEAFAHATRLTRAEASRLTLSTYATHFPPVAGSLTPRPGLKATQTTVDAWVLTHYTRYCPRCLAGDGTLIQQRHGGPWKTEWRLPVIFMCSRHRTFLHHLCPACACPAHAFHIGGSKVLPLIRLAGLHPAQCRNPLNEALPNRLSLCGHRLDDPNRAASLPPVSPALTRLQEQILLRLEATAQASEARRYFTDLRVLTTIVTATWPQARDLARDAVPETVDEYLSEQQHQARTRPRGRGRIPFTTFDHPPRSALATATLLHAADQLLTLPGPEFRQRLHTMLATAPPHPGGQWGQAWRHLHQHGSPTLKRQTPAAPGGRTTSSPQRPPTVFLRNPRYRIQHIPQWLPDPWLTHPPQVCRLTPRQAVLRRRAAAVRLVQIASGMPWQDAARYLGIPDSWRHGLPAHQRLPSHPGPDTNQITHLATTLDTRSRPTDHHLRRQHLAHWTLPTDHWHTLWNEAAHTSRSRLPASLQRTHQIASEFVWTLVTGSEHSIAPSLPGHTAGSRTTRHLWIPLTQTLPDQRPHRFYNALRQLLNDYAHQLAAETDHHHG
ncbi:TniQ family protein [Streptomyces sp. XH2]|uniref:TniQ family protein n=1 Tax=Streptomyces sp. XH2 TaxID=3412483 RepID=UPI003C7D7278